ncbi:MAG TPA: histidine--tRNA ligase [Candidatus Latescibacteria bacterium]|jgi:histidyl-tRNA synthetase|nr:histidine--tRNA ligase [Candidatus Latescibacterota bacterium]HJP31530.1 histidine--tRNA ligase [Candidatus Latescibacterota bacterium]
MNLNPPRGTRDFFPEDMRLRNWLFGHFREVARLSGFEEYDAPVVESADLYVRKAGEEIVDQLYTFQDKSNRELALRPEMTPSLARMVLQKGGALALPIKWFSLPQCWRYERMTRGRRREHFQWNMDIFGVDDVTAEAELLAVLVTLFKRLGLSAADVVIRLSNRRLLQAVLASAGVTDELFAPVCILVDKLEKIPREAVEADLQVLGVDSGVIDRVLEIASCTSLEAARQLAGDGENGLDELQRLIDLGAAYGFSEWLRFDPSLVRGLAYYTGTVFEVFPTEGDLRAVCGGGRYDRLLSTFGGKDVPACGFGFGDPVIVELLKDKGLLPDLPPAVDDVVFAFSEQLRIPAMEVATRLRASGRSVDLILEEGKRMKWAFRHADNAGAARLVLLAPDEWERGVVKVRDLVSGEESELTPEELSA